MFRKLTIFLFPGRRTEQRIRRLEEIASGNTPASHYTTELVVFHHFYDTDFTDLNLKSFGEKLRAHLPKVITALPYLKSMG